MKEIKFYSAYDNVLYRFDYRYNMFETWQIDEHNLKCQYNKQVTEDIIETFNFLKNTCQIPFKEINVQEFIIKMNKLQKLFEIQNKLIEMKTEYVKNVKEYINLF